MENCFDVVAERLTNEHIIYQCPYCWTKYKKDGTPYKTAKRMYHMHGNATHSGENRIEERAHHVCDHEQGKAPQNVRIHITDQTLKLIPPVLKFKKRERKHPLGHIH